MKTSVHDFTDNKLKFDLKLPPVPEKTVNRPFFSENAQRRSEASDLLLHSSFISNQSMSGHIKYGIVNQCS